MKLFITFLLVIFLTACQTNPSVPEERIVYNTILVTPPDELLKDCELQTPPNVDEYMKSDWSGKEELLVTAYNEATKKTILCSVSKKTLREWKQKQQEIYSTKDQKP
jgi:hypothetical protein